MTAFEPRYSVAGSDRSANSAMQHRTQGCELLPSSLRVGCDDVRTVRAVTILYLNVFTNGPSPASFSFIFDLFQTNINTIFTTNQCEKISSPSSIRSQDSNPRPLERESPPITTRPGLPPKLTKNVTTILIVCTWSLRRQYMASLTF